MTLPTECYRKQLSRHLKCDKEARERLLDSFDKNMAAPFLEMNAGATAEALQADLGTPQAVASVLMEQLTEEEILRYRKEKTRRKVLSFCSCLAIVVAVLAFALFTFYAKEYDNITYADYGVTEIGTHTKGN